MTPQVRDSQRLQEILSVFYAGRTTRDETRSAVLDVVLERLRCARVSMWKFSGDGDELSLLCFASKSAGNPLDTTERHLHRSEYRDYFNALIERGIYVSIDAMSDPALRPMRERYLIPNHVLSMLDAAFMLNGRAYGMMCCEETSAQRHWRPSDVAALRGVVTKLAVMMSGQADSILWTTPSVPLQAMPLTPAAPVPAPPGRPASERRS
jgi:hypothetical protein